MKLIAILRIKNEKNIIRRSMKRLEELVDEIIIVDNESTDGTKEIYQKYKKIIKVIDTVGFNEGRDKILLLEEAKKRKADWIIFLDADEIFEKNFNRKVIEKYMKSNYSKITFRLCHFWLNKNKCRIGKKFFLYSLHPIRIMWKNCDSAYFSPKKIHNGDIRGVKGRSYISLYRIKHYGYVDKDKVVNKLNMYKKKDVWSGRRYDHLSIDKKYFTIKFYEFNNVYINFLYIIAYKYIANLLWFFLRIVIFLKKMIKSIFLQTKTSKIFNRIIKKYRLNLKKFKLYD